MMAESVQECTNNTFTDISRPASRNVARRGRGRFPSRVNTAYGPPKSKEDKDYSDSEDSEYTRHKPESENVIQNSQSKVLSPKMSHRDVIHCENNSKNLPNVLSPNKRKSLENTSTDQKKSRVMMKKFRSQDCQRSGRIAKSVISSRRQRTTPVNFSRPDLDFDRQLLAFLTETSKTGDPPPIPFDDVIPATPERPSANNSLNRRTTFVAVFKKQSGLRSLNKSGNESINKEIKGDRHGVYVKSNNSDSAKENKINVQSINTGVELHADNMPRSIKSTPKTNINKTSQQTDIQRSKQTETSIKTNLNQEQPEASVPRKFKAIFKRVQKLNQICYNVPDNTNTEFISDLNCNVQNSVNHTQNVLTNKTIQGDVLQSEECQKEVIQQHTQSKGTLDKCAEKPMVVKRVRKPNYGKKKNNIMKEKIHDEELPKEISQSQTVIKETPSPVNYEEVQGQTVQTASSTNQKISQADEELNTEPKETVNKVIKVKITGGKNKNITKNKKPKTIKKNEKIQEGQEKLPAVKKLQKKIKELDCNVDTNKRKLPTRKTRQANKKYHETSSDESVGKVSSKTSVLSSKMCTRSHSETSKNSQKVSKNLEEQQIDEFFAKNNTANRENVLIDPETIQKMNQSSDDSEEERMIRPKHVVPKNSQSSLNKLEISRSGSQNQFVNKIINNGPTTPVKDNKQLQVFVTRSPQIEQMVKEITKPQEEEDEYVEIDLDDKMDQHRSARRSSTISKKRKLYSDKFNNFSDSDSETTKEEKEVNKSKKISTEAAQVYINNIQKERNKAQQIGNGKNNGGRRGRGRKGEKLINGIQTVRPVTVPKILEPSENANFSYRKAAEMTAKEKRLSDLFDMLKENHQGNYSDFEEDLTENEQSVFKPKKRRVGQKKPITNKSKMEKKAPQYGESIIPNNDLIDERIRSAPLTRVSDETQNIIMVDKNKDDDSLKITEQVIEMVPPSDEENMNDIQPCLMTENMNKEMEGNEHSENTKENPYVIVTDIISSKCDEHKASQKSEKTAFQSKANIKKTGKSKNKNIQTLKTRIQCVVPETDSCEMDGSLPSLIIEKRQNEAPVDESVTHLDLDKMKAIVGDITSTSYNVSNLDIGSEVDNENCEKQNDEIIVTSSHFGPETKTCGNAEYNNNQECIGDNLHTRVIQPEKGCHDSELVNARSDIHKEWIMNFQEDIVKDKQQSIIENLMELETSPKEQYIRRDRPKTINSEIKYNFSSPQGEAIVVLRHINEVSNHSKENVIADRSSDSDSEESVCSIILSSRKSRHIQSSNTDDYTEMFHCKKYFSNSNEKSRIPTLSKPATDKSISSSVLERISEESLHKSSHSTPKSIVSIDYTKYLDKHISPLRFTACKALPASVSNKSKAVESGDGGAMQQKSSPKKVVTYLPQWKTHRPPSKTVSRLSKGLPRVVSRVSSVSGMSVESPAESSEPLKTPIQKRKNIRSAPFFIPKSDAEKRFSELGCSMKTTMDTWLSSLNTMEQQIFKFRREIYSFKEDLPRDCCIKHRKK